jgi:CRISP-associated protein Cas1
MATDAQPEFDFATPPPPTEPTPKVSPNPAGEPTVGRDPETTNIIPEEQRTRTEEPLGIRMVNEFVYCPRLFYYETVEGIFVHNPDTLEGKEAHKRVDTPKPGRLESPEPEGAAKKRAAKKSAPTADQNAADHEADASPELPDTIHARSVSLFSALLNVTAKLDLVEGEAAAPGGPMLYTPVEYKKGRPREGDEGRELWDADRVQLMLQILLLRENGFPSEEGIVFYKETRQRVTFRPTEEDAAWASRMVAEARAAQLGPMPPPLDHSPKCPRCSLVGICLPDETRLMAEPTDGEAILTRERQLELGLASEAENHPPEPTRTALIDYVMRMPAPGIRRVKADPEMRRLIAPNPETRTLYLNTPGTWVGKSGETLTVKEKDKLIGEFHLKDLHHVALFGPIQVSTAVVQSLCEAEIPLTYFSTGGWFYGLTRGHTLKNVLTRIAQFRTAGDSVACLKLARLMVYGKIVNQRTLLMRNHIEPPKPVLHGLKYFAHAALMTTSIPQLLGMEGNAAALYFGALGGMLKAPETEDARPALPFPFYPDGRNRRPPRDPVNALLSLTYALLVKECTIACYAVGLDPYVGVMHQPRHGRPALALDVMEEFRPLLADSTVITLINNGMLTATDFILSSHAAALTPLGRKTVLTAWERRLSDAITHPLFGYKVSYRRAIELQVRLLAKSLTGEIGDYVPFMTR